MRLPGCIGWSVPFFAWNKVRFSRNSIFPMNHSSSLIFAVKIKIMSESVFLNDQFFPDYSNDM